MDVFHSFASTAGEMMASTLRLRPRFYSALFFWSLLLINIRILLHGAGRDAKSQLFRFSSLRRTVLDRPRTQIFDREGLKTELLYINAAPRVMAAMLAGEIQVALSTASVLS